MSKNPRSIFTSFSRPNICLSCRAKILRREDSVSARRSITRNHIIRIQEAEQSWKERKQAINDGQKQSMLQFLEDRGYVHQIVGTRENLNDVLTQRRVGIYCGVDPTAPSLHVGHLVPFMALNWLYIHGYSATYLMGGMTSRIGDPTDRTKARPQLSRSDRKAATYTVHQQLKRLGRLTEAAASRKGYQREWAWRRDVQNNAIWMDVVSIAEFMRVMGPSVRMGPMLGRDFVKSRIEGKDGMSFAEFAYPLLQAWDWWHLYKKGVQVQIGGADQFGNMLAGIEAIKSMRKIEQVDLGDISTAHLNTQAPIPKAQLPRKYTELDNPIGFTVPLLTSSSGVKFGKSEGNAIWLDPQMTSVFDFYQFFLRSSDADVEQYLKLFTFLALPEIEEIMTKHRQDESKMKAQKQLAYEVTELIHGQQAASEAHLQHQQLYGSDYSVGILSEPLLSTPEPIVQPEDPSPGYWSNSLNKFAKPASMERFGSVKIKLPRSLVIGQPMNRVLWSAGLVSSRGEGYRLIANKGCHVGSRKSGAREVSDMEDRVSYVPITQVDRERTEDFILDGGVMVLRVGKWKIKIVQIVEDDEYERSGLSCPGWKGEGDEQQPVDYKEFQREQTAFLAKRKQDKAEGRKQRLIPLERPSLE